MGNRRNVLIATVSAIVILFAGYFGRKLLWSRWKGIWRWWTQSSNVEISTGLLVDPLVGLRILRGSSSRKMIFRLFLY